MTASFITRNGCRLAFHHTAVTNSNADKIPADTNPASTHPSPTSNGTLGVIFCGGFNSSMQGLKALSLEASCIENNISFTRFDYSGHGESDGKFTEGDIGHWFKDALFIVDHVATSDRLIVIGSSMGAWIATLVAEQRTNRVAGLLTLAAAPDFTEKLLLAKLPEQQRVSLSQGNTIHIPNEYDDGTPYPVSPNLIEQSRKHCVLNRQIALNIPVRLLHGTHDNDVPYDLSMQLLQAISSKDVQLTLIKQGDHRLSSAAHLQTINQCLLELIDTSE